MTDDSVDLFEPGSFHVEPLGMAEAVRRLPNATTSAITNSIIVKPTSGLLYGFTVTNTNAGGQFVLVFDQNTVPSNGSVPILAAAVAASSFVPMVWIPPRAFRNGIVLCNSTTNASLTIGAADCIFDVQYI